MTKELIMLVGPCGSGKSTMARHIRDQRGFTYINQDSQGRQHLDMFDQAVLAGKNVVVDRMNFTKVQRTRYLGFAKEHGYHTTIVVLHVDYETCFARCMSRSDHETIKEEKAARSALNMFFSKYERVEDSEADVVERRWPDGPKPMAIVCDLDGTLCNVSHRRHFVRPPENTLVGPDGSMICVLGQYEPVGFDKPLPKFKKDWVGFFKAMSDDEVNVWCADILKHLGHKYQIVLCSGRPDDYRRKTEDWLAKHSIAYDDLFMRMRSDSRQDNIVKEIILDFEILTRYTPHFMIDDRDQVVQMWRKRGYTCLQCDDGAF